MSDPIFLRDYTRYSADPGSCDGRDTLYIPKEDLKLLQKLQEELEGEDCVFLASGPREEEGGKPRVIQALGGGGGPDRELRGHTGLPGKECHHPFPL